MCTFYSNVVVACVCVCLHDCVCCVISLHVFGKVLALDLSYAVEYVHVHTIIHLNVSIL